ncbi:hypothetical protein COCON_G00125000 [Conger conger]|uniref:Rab-GAP TBC domain-containing protein n=1 Tax=Conger conger TaxID=82655 RepID=A0A9Q1DCN4_CONCO|nr:hypothetical protein COCON_G00125000 [Conger conger]
MCLHSRSELQPPKRLIFAEPVLSLFPGLRWGQNLSIARRPLVGGNGCPQKRSTERSTVPRRDHLSPEALRFDPCVLSCCQRLLNDERSIGRLAVSIATATGTPVHSTPTLRRGTPQAEDHETGVDPLQNFNRTRPRGSLESSGSVPFTPSESTFLSYRKEWDELFLDSNYLARIRPAGTNGRLRSSRYRSVCWKLYLDILPEDKNQWINKTKELRAQYERIKETDLMVNNPLSQDEGSLWNKFFQDKELRGMIRQDVLRTFPEMQYFQQEDVRAKLTDILFCYARENEQLLYKQVHLITTALYS